MACRAALWYDTGVTLESCKLNGIKALRECQDITLINCEIIGTQPFCYCKNLVLENCTMNNCDPDKTEIKINSPASF